MQRFLFFIFLLFFSAPAISQEKSSEVTCEPYYINKKIAGFTCPQLHQESLLSKMGIQTNDILLEFNGTQIDSFKSMQSFYEKLHRKGEMELKIRRGHNVYSVKNKNM